MGRDRGKAQRRTALEANGTDDRSVAERDGSGTLDYLNNALRCKCERSGSDDGQSRAPVRRVSQGG